MLLLRGVYPLLEYGFLFSFSLCGLLHVFINPITSIQINRYNIHTKKAPIAYHTEICNSKCKISNITPGIAPSIFNSIFIKKDNIKFASIFVLLIFPPTRKADI